MKTHIKTLLAALTASAMIAGSAKADIIFTEDFENPDIEAFSSQNPSTFLPAGAYTFDNPATLGNNDMKLMDPLTTYNGLDAFSGDQFLDFGGQGRANGSIEFVIAAANTLVNGTDITVKFYMAGIFSNTVDETYDVILSGGATGTQSGAETGAQDTWQLKTHTFTVTDNTQAITLLIDFTRASSASEDGAIDFITVEGTPIPEPGSLALLGLGGLCLLRRRRK